MTLPPLVDSDYFYLLMLSMTNMSFCLAIIEKKKYQKPWEYETAEQGYEEQLVTVGRRGLW